MRMGIVKTKTWGDLSFASSDIRNCMLGGCRVCAKNVGCTRSGWEPLCMCRSARGRIAMYCSKSSLKVIDRLECLCLFLSFNRCCFCPAAQSYCPSTSGTAVHVSSLAPSPAPPPPPPLPTLKLVWLTKISKFIYLFGSVATATSTVLRSFH